MKSKVRIDEIIKYGIFVLLVLDIPYIQHVLGHMFPIHLVIEAVLIALIAIAYLRGNFISWPICFLLVFLIYMLFATVFCQGSPRIYVLDFTLILIICFYFHLINLQKNALERVIRQWVFFLTVIVILDLISIILVPKGLYLGSETVIGSSKNKNWILGYKTNRLKYSLPLLVFYTYNWFNKSAFRLIYTVVPIIVLADIYLSGGDAGTVVVLLYILVSFVIIYSSSHKGIASSFFSKFLKHYWLFFAVFAVVDILIVIVQNNSTFYQTVMAFFSKSDTLGNRTLLWQNCLNYITKHLWFGHGVLHTVQYIELTGGYVNPHNIVFSYLMTGGLIGLILFSLFIISSLRHLNRSNSCVFFLLGIYCIFILGVTSSTLSFSPFLYVFFILIYNNKDNMDRKGIRNRRSIIWA